jgi:hypothetical protein
LLFSFRSRTHTGCPRYRLSSESPVLQGGDVESGCIVLLRTSAGQTLRIAEARIERLASKFPGSGRVTVSKPDIIRSRETGARVR